MEIEFFKYLSLIKLKIDLHLWIFSYKKIVWPDTSSNLKSTSLDSRQHAEKLNTEHPARIACPKSTRGGRSVEDHQLCNRAGNRAKHSWHRHARMVIYMFSEYAKRRSSWQSQTFIHTISTTYASTSINVYPADLNMILAAQNLHKYIRWSLHRYKMRISTRRKRLRKDF